MKLFQLFESAQTDVVSSAKAEKIIFGLYNYLYENLERDPNFQLPEVEFRGITSLCFPVADIDREYSDLLIVFRKTNPGINATYVNISGSSSEFNHLIILNIDGDESFIRGRLLNSTIQSSFHHELQHYFDVKRYKNRTEPDADYVEDGSLRDEQFRQSYYNNPMEFNAYFHNLAAPLLKVLKLFDESPEFAKDFMYDLGYKDTFEEFLNSSIKNAGNRYKIAFNNFNPVYRKKLLKRLYSLYKAIQDKL